MRRMVGLYPGFLDGGEVRRALAQMEAPTDVARSEALFDQVMARLAAQERRHRRVRQIGQLAQAAVAVVTGAGAYRLLTR